MKKTMAALLAVLLCGLLVCPALAAVSTTSEAAAGPGVIYVAGCPDWYPVEYYDDETKSFQGILPQLLEEVSQRTGLDFVYLRGGESDQRLRMADNKQADLISACTAAEGFGQFRGVLLGEPLFSATKDGERVEVFFAYTGAGGRSLRRQVEGALEDLSKEGITAVALDFMTSHPPKSLPGWLLPTVFGIFALVLLILGLIYGQLRKRNQIAQELWRDPVTGAGNKAYFLHRLEEIPKLFKELYCVVYIGFDITRVNQYYGEEDAEEQLRYAADELNKSLSSREDFARVSGGGFAIARPTSSEKEIAQWTQELLERLNCYSDKYEKDYHPLFSAGIYMLQRGESGGNILIQNARWGYLEAVKQGQPYAFSRAEQLSLEGEQLQLKKQTLEAIHSGQFKMLLQFVVRPDGSIYGAEALSRWEHPQRGLLYPGSYIDLMESERTISELDFFILEESCRQLESWEKEGRDLSLSCNFARITIDQENFVLRLRTITEAYHFDHSRLVLEITEDSLEGHKQSAFDNISKCKAMGFRIALDDMGSGFTSFSDLRDYPIDVAKIDRSILLSAMNRQGMDLLRGMIALCHSLGMEVQCEGVETPAQLELLRQLGCDYLQGYYFYRALPQKEANRILAQSSAGAPKEPEH